MYILPLLKDNFMLSNKSKSKMIINIEIFFSKSPSWSNYPNKVNTWSNTSDILLPKWKLINILNINMPSSSCNVPKWIYNIS
jgi:hypothetical protein